ncbi:MAG: adenine phosphoribosyltransferase [Saprospiraceae bacterium]|jgi:adenine phosphoribosyltransferase
MNEVQELLANVIRDVPDFPKKGIVFKDITPLFQDPIGIQKVLAALVDQAQVVNPNVVVGIDSRGFLLGNAIAMALGVPFVMARKKGKLPYDKISKTYQLEYGMGEIEMHKDSFEKGTKVLVHDDLLATGGTGSCVGELVERLGGEVVAFSFIINLSFLKGERLLKNYSKNILSLIEYN